MPYKLLFVCLGNICRSPAAENIMNYLLAKDDLQEKFVCDSAGMGNWHVGSPPDQRMSAAALKKLGITLQGEARQFKFADFEAFDLILAMDQENRSDILRLDSKKQYHHKVRLMCDFCQNYPDKEVPDPYYGGSEGFNYVIDLLTDACNGLLQSLEDSQSRLNRK